MNDMGTKGSAVVIKVSRIPITNLEETLWTTRLTYNMKILYCVENPARSAPPTGQAVLLSKATTDF